MAATSTEKAASFVNLNPPSSLNPSE
jgi:hypothetical protein